MQATPAHLRKPFFSWILIATCVGMFWLQLQAPQYWIVLAALWPAGEYFAPWQPISYAFLHGDVTHLLFNMLGLYMFGGDVERIIGARRMAVLFFVSVLIAAGAQLAVSAGSSEPYPTVGASGGLFGIMLVFALLFPKAKVVPLFPPIPMPAWLFVTLYAGIELWMGVTGSMQGIAHFAHLGGLVGGAVMWFWWRAQARRRPR